MTYDEAVKVAAAHAPKLNIAPFNAALPQLLCVSKDGADPRSAPFSIHIPESMPKAPATDEQQQASLTDALDAASKYLGVTP